MFILDTNVLSELLRPAPAAQVAQWVTAQPRVALFTTTVTRGELLYGAQLLPEGQRRKALQAAVLAVLDEDLAGQVISFDQAAADAYAAIAAGRRSAGLPISQLDAMIAGITRSRGAAVVTRNVKDFERCGIEVVNPWAFR